MQYDAQFIVHCIANYLQAEWHTTLGRIAEQCTIQSTMQCTMLAAVHCLVLYLDALCHTGWKLFAEQSDQNCFFLLF